MRQLITQSFRAYAAIAVIVAGFTALWALGVISVAIPLVGYAWLAVAGLGTIITVGMLTKPKETSQLPHPTSLSLPTSLVEGGACP